MDLNEKITEEKAFLLNPVVLAFVGDAVFTLFVRERLSTSVDKRSGVLSEMAAKVVCAESQAKLAVKMLDELTEREKSVYTRARNAKKTTRAKHSTAIEYNKSTGFEAVLGYLYLSGQTERLYHILHLGE